MYSKMITTRPKYKMCTELSICDPQEHYKLNSLGKFKVKYQKGVSYCYFCGSDLKARMYLEGIKTK